MELIREKSHIMDTHVYKYLIKKFFKRPVLDLGSGSFFENVDCAIDLHDEKAKDYTSFIKHDLNIRPYLVKEKFKTILCLRVMEYIRNPKAVVTEAFRLLEDNGVFIVTLSENKENYKKWVNGEGMSLKTNELKVKELRGLLEAAGFNVKEYCNSKLNFNQDFFQPLWKLVNGNLVYFVCKKRNIS